MSRLEPLLREKVPREARGLMEFGEELIGFTSNDSLIKARNPAILKASANMVAAIYGQGTLSSGLKRLIGYVKSSATGCKYCQVHTADGAHKAGVQADKIKVAWEFETSSLFSERERAALRVARGGGLSPSNVSDAEFADLKTNFNEDEIIQIVGMFWCFRISKSLEFRHGNRS